MTTTFDEEKAPVFNLKQMIEDEAQKLKNEVRVYKNAFKTNFSVI